MTHFIDSAKRLVYRNGISVTYVSVTEGTYNTSTGTVTNTETETVITAYPKGVKVNQYNYPNLIGKEVIEYLVVATDLASVPNPQDKIKRGTSVYTISAINEVVAHGVTTIYKLLAVKG